METYQEILIMDTYKPDLRSEAFGWSLESGSIAVKAIHQRGVGCEVGLIGAPMRFYSYSTPLHALGAQYKLLAPPTSYEIDINPTKEYAKRHGLELGQQKQTLWTWYFVKDVEE
jgi:hypothetical protein